MAELMNPVEQIRNNLKTGKLVFGTKRTLKELAKGNLEKIFVSSNIQGSSKDDIDYYAKIADVEVAHLGIPNDELAVVCKKTYSIAVIGLLK